MFRNRNQIGLALCAAVGIAASAAVADERSSYGPGGSYREHARLPRGKGATVMGDILRGVAIEEQARGDLIESIAHARAMHAEGYRFEVDNWKHYVQTYFDVKRINQLYAQQKRGSYLASLLATDQVMRSFGELLPHKFQASQGPAGAANDVLRRLEAANVTYVAVDRLGLDDPPLSTEQLAWIRLKRSIGSGRAIVFSASLGDALSVGWWPVTLRDDSFASVRSQLNSAMRGVKQELLQQGEISQLMQRELEEALANFRVTLDEAKSVAVSCDAQNDWAEASKWFNHDLKKQVKGVVAVNERSLVDGSMRFASGTTLDLVRHMHQYGLEFADPPVGGQLAYQPLYYSLRAVWQQLEPPAHREPGGAEDLRKNLSRSSYSDRNAEES